MNNFRKIMLIAVSNIMFVLAVSICLPVVARAQNAPRGERLSPGAPLQLSPGVLRGNQGGTSGSERSTEPAVTIAPPFAAEPPFVVEPPWAVLRGQVVPEKLFTGQQNALYTRRNFARRGNRALSGDMIAGQVFQRNILGGERIGFFLQAPNGLLYALDVTPDKLKHVEIRAEIRRLALQIRLRERRKLTKLSRAQHFERLRQRRLQQARRSARPRSLSEYFSDTSLQAGDVVVTNGGLRVFRGSPDFPYNASHFVPLAQWRKQGGGTIAKRDSAGRKLDALQRELRRGR